MGISSTARPARIDDEAKRIHRAVIQANSQLAKAINEARQFTAFMHDNPLAEFDQADRDKYSNMFTEAAGALMATMNELQPMQAVELGAMTPAEYVAAQEGYVSAEYSARFD